MAQAGADMRFGVNEILHLLIATTILLMMSIAVRRLMCFPVVLTCTSH